MSLTLNWCILVYQLIMESTLLSVSYYCLALTPSIILIFYSPPTPPPTPPPPPIPPPTTTTTTTTRFYSIPDASSMLNYRHLSGVLDVV